MRARLLLAALLALSAAAPAAQSTAPAPTSRDAAWRDDLAFFAREFAGAQKDFAALYPRDRFADALTALTTSITTTTDGDLTLGLMRLVASAHVGHTNLRLPMDGPLAFHRLPLVVRWFSDGLVVAAATEPYRDAIGLRVTAIGTLSPERLESAVAPYISYEHDAWLHPQSQTFLIAAEVLRAVGQVQPDGRVRLTLARADGTPLTLEVAPVPWRDAGPFITAVDALHIPSGPARLEPNRYYRYQLLPDAKALYIRYSRCMNDPAQPFTAFVDELFAAVDSNPAAVQRVVIDLRDNGGGDSRIIQPLVDRLKKRKALSARGHLFVLMGPATFSSGVMAAANLKRTLHATLIGEPPGERPNSYGEVRLLTLPNSGLVVQYSTKFFQLVKGGDPATFEPDLTVRRSIADYLGGRDPVLEAALTHGRPRR